MTAKSIREPIHESNSAGSHRTYRLRERRFYELDRVYLRQLRRLSQIVWNAKLKHDTTLSKPIPKSLNNLRTSSGNQASPSQIPVNDQSALIHRHRGTLHG